RLGDGTVVHIPGDPVSSFPAWCAAMERTELLDDERFATRESRNAHRADMIEVLNAFAATFASFDAFETAIGRAGLAVGAMHALRDAQPAEWSQHRGAVVDIDVDGQQAIALPRSPFRFSAASAGTAGRPAYQGEHNREVLRDVLDLDEAAIDALERDGVLVS